MHSKFGVNAPVAKPFAGMGRRKLSTERLEQNLTAIICVNGTQNSLSGESFSG